MIERDETVIDAALGGPWETIGELLQHNGQEDASGARRWIAGLLMQKKYDRVCELLKIDRGECERLRIALICNS